MELEAGLDVELNPEAISDSGSDIESDTDQWRWNIEEDTSISYSTYLNKQLD
jgi:hypothetical protein